MKIDFIGLGAQKAGTTWLHENLKMHPEIYMPPHKEIHFFDQKNSYPTVFNYLHSDSKSLKKAIYLIYKTFFNRNWKWYMRFAYLPRSEKWYDSLFHSHNRLIAGEITPKYAKIDLKIIQQIAWKKPSLKIVYLIRNPINRSWSKLRMQGRKEGRNMRCLADLQNINIEGLIKHSQYSKNLDNWMTYFPEDQFFIGFYEEVKESPQQLLQRLFEFLGVHEYLSSKAHEEINVNRIQMDIPKDIEYYLTEMFIAEIRTLHHRFSNKYTQDWLDNAHKVLDK